MVNGGVVHRAVPCADPGVGHALDARRLSLGLRVPAFALITTGVTISGHVAAHGGPPSAGVTLGLVAASAAARFVLGVRTRSFAPIAALMAVGQLAGHTVLAAAESTTIGPAVVASGHQHVPAIGAAAPLQMSAAMMLAHVVVALALAWWLFRGEALSDALGRRLAQRLGLPTTPRLETSSTWSPHGFGGFRVVPSRFLLAPAPGRAPPTRW